MEPISISFEAGEPAPGREPMQQAQGGDFYNLSPGFRFQAKLISGLADFPLRGTSVGGMFCRDTCHPEKAIFSLIVLLFPEKQKKVTPTSYFL